MDASITVIITPINIGQSPSEHIKPLSYPYSLALDSELWEGLHEICRRENTSLNEACTAIYMTMGKGQTLEQGVRFFIFDYFRCAATDEGHLKAGHGQGPAFIGDTFH